MSVLISWDIVTKLMNCFPNSVINHNAEFIAHIKSNTYFGNRCNHAKTLKFMESGYDMSVLKD